MSHSDSHLLSHMNHCDSYLWVTMALTYDSLWPTLTHYESCPILSFIDSLTVLGLSINEPNSSVIYVWLVQGNTAPELTSCILLYRKPIAVLSPFLPLPAIVSPLKHSLKALWLAKRLHFSSVTVKVLSGLFPCTLDSGYLHIGHSSP